MGSVHLVRHGQASWGAADYDQLSDLGFKQGGAVGMAWEASGWAPTSVVAGGMKRHAQTAISTIDASGQGDGYEVDGRWDEFDHLALARAQDPTSLTHDARAFQQSLNRAIDAWRAGTSDGSESYQDFRTRVLDGFAAATEQAGPGRTCAVFTSGGPISMIASHLLAGDDSLFQRLNDVIVNAGVTTVIVGRTGHRLLTFNEHTHLPRDWVTFR